MGYAADFREFLTTRCTWKEWLAVATVSLYAASLILSAYGSSLPLVTSCQPTSEANTLSLIGALLGVAGGLASLAGLLAARGRRLIFLGLFMVMFIALYVALVVTLAPGDCHPFN